MDTTSVGTDSDFELPAPFTFQRIFQSCPFWAGAVQGLIPQVVKRLRRTGRKHSFLLDAHERQLVLSVAAEESTHTEWHDPSFGAFIAHAAEAGVGPKLIFNSADQGYVVTEYLEGRCWQSEEFRVMGNIERLSRLLKTVHGLPKIACPENPLQTVTRYWCQIQGEYAKPPKRLDVLQSRMARVIDYATLHFDEQVVCHNNLLNSHVIDTPEGLKLVGWEYAAINDPFHDLAVIVHHHGFNEGQLDHLLFCYAGRNGCEERERFYYRYAIYIYLSALTYWLQCAKRPKLDQEEKVESMTDVLVALLHQIGQ